MFQWENYLFDTISVLATEINTTTNSRQSFCNFSTVPINFFNRWIISRSTRSVESIRFSFSSTVRVLLRVQRTPAVDHRWFSLFVPIRNISAEFGKDPQGKVHLWVHHVSLDTDSASTNALHQSTLLCEGFGSRFTAEQLFVNGETLGQLLLPISSRVSVNLRKWNCWLLREREKFYPGPDIFS